MPATKELSLNHSNQNHVTPTIAITDTQRDYCAVLMGGLNSAPHIMRLLHVAAFTHLFFSKQYAPVHHEIDTS